MIKLFGIEIIKLNFFMRGLIFSASLILALHYGLLIFLHSFSEFMKGNWKKSALAVLYAVLVGGIFYLIIKDDFVYRVLAYILLVLYSLVVLSRTFVNWYSRTEEISKKLDRIIELLEKK